MSTKTKADLLREIDDLTKKLLESYDIIEQMKTKAGRMAFEKMKKDSSNETLKEIEELKIENSKLNGLVGRLICEKNELSLELDKLNKTIELNNEFYKNNDTMKRKLDETLILSAKKTSKIFELEKEIEELKSNNSVHKSKNERGAGRKERFSQTEKQAMKMYRLQGKSIREIARIYECSVGLIHKLINEK